MKDPTYEPWIETYTGKRFHFLDPKDEEIDIIDIAHSLAMQCRYTGHTSAFYSVAEHSVIVSLLVPPALALEGLLHDGAEAYLSDVAGPLKPHVHGYKELEDGVMNILAKKYGFNWPVSFEVKQADQIQLVSEAKYLMFSEGKDWPKMFQVEGRYGKVPKCFTPAGAKALFLDRFFEITGEKKQEVPKILIPTMH